MTMSQSEADIAARRAKALAIASRISSSVLGKHARSESAWPVSDGSGHGVDRTSAKVFVPIDKQANYYGLLVGPGGQILKDLENKSGATLSIRGKGSSADGNDQSPDEGLHVFIEGRGEAQVAAAERLLSEMLYNRETQDEQYRAAAERKNNTLLLSDRLYASDVDYPPFRGAGEKSKIINVAANAVGQIIGRGGDTIKMLQTKTGAFIQVSRESDPSSNMKTVTLEGTASQIEHAEDEIMKILHENEQRDQIRGGSSLGGGAGLGFSSDNITEIIRIPHDAVGLLIGKGGLTIKQLQMRTGCNIQVQRDVDADPSSITRDVTLNGTPRQLEEAKREVLSLVQGHGSDIPVESVIPGMIVITLMIPGSCVGGIIGRQGETIKAIQHRSQARVQVSRDVSLPEREITVSGSDQAVQMAKLEIENIVAESQARESGDRSDRHRRSNDSYDNGYQDPYSRQAATYGSDQYYGAAAYGAAGFYGANPYAMGYGMQQPYYGGYDASAYPAATPGTDASTGEPAAESAAEDAQPSADGTTPEDPNAASVQQWQAYCMQYYAYYGQYPPEAYGTGQGDPSGDGQTPAEGGQGDGQQADQSSYAGTSSQQNPEHSAAESRPDDGSATR